MGAGEGGGVGGTTGGGLVVAAPVEAPVVAGVLVEAGAVPPPELGDRVGVPAQAMRICAF